jgi:predicted amidohydrolase YtcJ
MLIRDAEIAPGRVTHVQISGGLIGRIGGDLRPDEDGIIVEARGGALLPGLHDHHFHLLSFAASLESVECGPPLITSASDLIRILRSAPRTDGENWLRGVGYHESVAGEIDRDWLDQAVPDRPVRVQHRGGRLWILNSRAIETLTASTNDTPLERESGRFTGRLYEGDGWLRHRLGNRRPSLHRASQFLLSRGVTGITDATPTNTAAEFELFRQAFGAREVVQSILVMGDATLDHVGDVLGIQRGATKIHLRDAVLPPLDEIAARIRHSHAADRPVAVHCVTLGETLLAIGGFQDAGAIQGDRIEHAAIAPPDILAIMAELGLTVVTQPNFVAERGDAYLRDVDPRDRRWLYRLRGFLDSGIAVAGGTDAPFGGANPWRAMAAAVERHSSGGSPIGPEEALTPEQALGLFLSAPRSLGGTARTIMPSADADLCLLQQSWRDARSNLADVSVALTIKSGAIAWDASAR